jgi:hypothetical protein
MTNGMLQKLSDSTVPVTKPTKAKQTMKAKSEYENNFRQSPS